LNDPQSPLRIGAVSFLNTVPLIHGLDRDPGVVMMRDLPARLSDLLYEERIEVGLLPVVEYLRGIGGDIVPGICIASHGPVRTVKLFSQCPIEEADDIAVDRGSRSSVALLRVLLAEMYGRQPDLHIVEPRPEELFLHHRSVLVIGDRAEQVRVRDGVHVYDLGQLWHELSGLPFVFAAWVLNSDLTSERHALRRQRAIERLSAAKRAGLSCLSELSHLHAAVHGQRAEQLLDYWQNAIGYDLGEAELAGLRRFAELATKHRLCSARDALSVAEA
jgi:chorismate dehydratase